VVHTRREREKEGKRERGEERQEKENETGEMHQVNEGRWGRQEQEGGEQNKTLEQARNEYKHKGRAPKQKKDYRERRDKNDGRTGKIERQR
jgi:hypothetical protein